MTIKKVIDKPTYKTNPGIIIRRSAKDIIHTINNYAPRDFNTAREVNTIKNKYLFDDPKSIKRKLERFLFESNYDFIIATLLFITVIASFLLLLFSFTYIIDMLPIYDFIKQILFAIGLIASILGGPWAVPKVLDTYTDTAYFTLSHKERKAFAQAEFVNLDYRLPQQLDPYARTYVLNINALFDHDEDILDTVDLSEIRRAYDNYMDLYVFLRVNANIMSQSLYTEYKDELHRRGTTLNHEIVELNKLIKSNKESKAELLSQQQEIAQDMIDDDVRRAMPIVKPNEL